MINIYILVFSHKKMWISFLKKIWWFKIFFLTLWNKFKNSGKEYKTKKIMGNITIGEVIENYNLTTDGYWILDSIEKKHPIRLTGSQVDDFLELIEFMNSSKRNENRVRKVESNKPIITYDKNGKCTLNIF